jgi:glycosyltransferase involved in cell wall biosynthesis
MGYDATAWNSKLGTAVGYPFVIKKLRENLFDLIEHCEKSVALTKWYRDVLIKNKIPEDKLVYIPQAAPHNYCKHLAERKSTLPIKCIFIGRINHAKGVHLLIESIRNFSEQSIMLDIFGQDNGDAYTKRCKEESANMPNIQWKGLLQPDDVHDTLENYDVLCIPSLICEMSPLVIQEAFAAGIPVLASSVSGNAEQIRHNVNGWLFDFNSTLSLREQLKKLIEKPSLIDEAKKYIPEVNGFKNVAEEYTKLYCGILPEAS